MQSVNKENYVVDFVVEAIVNHQLVGLSQMGRDLIALLPKKYLVNCAQREIPIVWSRLPNHLKADPEVQKYKFCLDHYQYSVDSNCDTFDGPLQKYKCPLCISSSVKEEEEEVK